ncbi:Phosphatidylglycerol/phosphatidylinositol transfer protein [Sorochytrium milnesiophthora]
MILLSAIFAIALLLAAALSSVYAQLHAFDLPAFVAQWEQQSRIPGSGLRHERAELHTSASDEHDGDSDGIHDTGRLSLGRVSRHDHGKHHRSERHQGDYWRLCSEKPKDDLAKIKHIKFKPNRVVRGQKIDIDIKGTLKEPLDEGSMADVRVQIAKVPMIHLQVDVCDLLRHDDVGQECPVGKGPVHFKAALDTPDQAPTGHYTIILDVSNQRDEHVTCVALDVDLK